MFILTTSQKRWGVVVIVMTLIGAICETLGVSVILPLVQVMIAPEELQKQPVIASVAGALGISSPGGFVWLVGAAVIFVYLIKNLFLLLLSYVRVKYACKVQRELSVEMLESYMDRGYVFFLNATSAELMRGVINGIQNTYTGLCQIFKLFAETLTLTAICIYIMVSDFFMALCVMLLALICLLVVALICQKWVKRWGEIYYKYTASIGKILMQTFQGIKEILVMGRKQYFVDEYHTAYCKQQKGNIGQTVAMESPAYIIEAICVSGLIVAVCIKAIGADDASALVPQLAAFAVAAFRILPSLGRISNYFNQFMFSLPGINDTYVNFKEVRKNDVNRQAGGMYVPEKLASKQKFTDKISVEGVTWHYPDTKDKVLDDLSIDIRKGQSVALVGRSGAGKTTLADVILGLLNPPKGTVKIDGVDIRSMERDRSRLIGFVPQNVNLLDDTVRRNVAFGVKDADIDDELVWKALEQAQLKEIIENCANGLDTQIGEHGIHFSGGQRQRFAIARALYTDPDILILDEATSALDTETETAVMEAIDALQGQKTLIIIAHRLTTIRNCDVIYEIADGKAVKRTYHELTDERR